MELRKALVIRNDDPNETGRIKVRILPELKDVVEESKLRWIYPFMLSGGGLNSEHDVPEVNEYVTVIIKDPYWLYVEYIPSDYTIDNYPYSDFGNISSNMTELGSQIYPQPKWIKKFNDGTLMFHNSETGEHGVYNNNGSYWIFDSNGNLILNSKSKKISVKNTQADLYEILTHIQELLNDIVSNTNWIGNFGAPIQFVPYTSDATKVSQLKTDIDNLMNI